MKKQLDFLVQYEDRISRLAKALKWKIYHLLFGFSAQASTLGVFKHASGLGSTNLQIFRFNFPTKRLWASLICSKTARYRLFLAVVRCCVTTTLAAETFSLLSVYLNYKFGLGLPSFHLFFSLFKLIFTTSVGYKKRLCYRWPVLDCECEKMTNYLKLFRRRLFQPIEFSLSKFDRLDPSYQTSKARIR